MAATTSYIQSDTNLESWADVIGNISPVDTPVLSKLRKVKVSATLHEWAKDTLANAASNAKVEGAAYSYAAAAARTRETNDTQIFEKTWSVSRTQEEVLKAGTSSEWEYQADKSMKELARDMEYAYINGTGASGADGTARELKGIVSFITTNVTTGTGSGSEALTENMFNENLQAIWDQGGKADWALVNGTQKRVISQFTTNYTKNIDVDDKKLTNSVEVYDSDFGRIMIDLERYLDKDKVLILETDKWAIGDLRPVNQKEPAETGDSREGVWIAESTLVAYNEASSGKITELSTAVA